jgi:hypothetical protein
MDCYPDSTNWGAKDWSNATAEQLEQKALAELLAWTSLQMLTGHRLSICATAVRPARATCAPATYYLSPGDAPTGLFHPYIGLDGRWFNAVHGGACRCNDARELTLPDVVARMVSVEIDGEALPASAYRVDNGTILVRTDGKGWPLRQDMNAQSGDVGSFVVTYFAGAAPDTLANYAAGLLAREFLLNMAPEKGRSCRLPSRVKAVTRQGVSYDLSTSMFEVGQSTGVPEVDIFVQRLNPFGLRVPSRVLSMDTIDDFRTASARGGTIAPVAGNLVPDPILGPGYYRLEP